MQIPSANVLSHRVHAFFLIFCGFLKIFAGPIISKRNYSSSHTSFLKWRSLSEEEKQEPKKNKVLNDGKEVINHKCKWFCLKQPSRSSFNQVKHLMAI